MTMSHLANLYPGHLVVELCVLVAVAVTAMTAAAWAGSLLLERYPPLRHWVLLSALVASLASPCLTAVFVASGTSFIAVPILAEPIAEPGMHSNGWPAGNRPATTPERFFSESEFGPASGDLSTNHSNAVRVTPTAPARNATVPNPFRTAAVAALLVWLGGTVVSVIGLVRSGLLLHRLRRSMQPVSGAELAGPHSGAMRLLAARGSPKIMVSPLARTPMAAGWFRPVIVLPCELLGAITPDQLCDVLTHEIAHIERRDNLIVLLQAIAKAIYWPIPFVHLLNWQLERAREEICDNHVLAGRDAVSYGETLLRVAHLACGESLSVGTMGMLHWRGNFKKRISGILHRSRNTMTHTHPLLASGVLALFVSASVLLCGTTIGQVRGSDPVAKDQPKPEVKPVAVTEKATINGLAWDAKGETVVTAGFTLEVAERTVPSVQDPLKVLVPNSNIKLWDATTGELKRSLVEAKGILIRALALSPDRKTAAVTTIKFTDENGMPLGGSRGTEEVRLMDAEKWELKRKVDPDGADGLFTNDYFLVYAVAFSPDGKTLAMGGAGPRVEGGCYLKLWDVEKQKLIGGTKATREAEVGSGLGEAVNSLAFSPDGNLLAAACMDGKLRLFDGRTGEFKSVWDDDSARPAWWIVFSPDGKSLVSQGRDNLKVWDVETAKVRRTLQGNKAWVMAAAFSPDGKVFATGGIVRENDKVSGGEVILWDAQTGDLKHTLPRQTLPVSMLAFSPDGKTLAVTGGTHGDLKDGGKTAGEIKLFPLESLATER